MLDLTIPEHSYAYGLFLSDGSLSEESRNRGRLSISLKKSDENILYKIKDIFICNSYISTRERVTNFGYIEETTLRIYDINFRNKLKEYGFPVGKKAHICNVPSKTYIENDFYRGFVDGDGSLGFTKNNFPFVSITTKSNNFYENYKKFVKKTIDFDVNVKPNKRDNVYNIMLNRENSQEFIKNIYYEKCLSIKRKYIISQDVQKWIRPDNLIKRNPTRKWDKEQDLYILNHDISDSIKTLGRTEQSIKARLHRIKGGYKND